MRTVRLGVAASRGGGGSAQSCLDGKLNDAATRLDPLNRDDWMLDNLARNSFEFCFAACKLANQIRSNDRQSAQDR
jgi:hypothetical protein